MERERQLRDRGLHAAHPAEAAHQLLEGQRPARRVEGHHLAVQDERGTAEITARDGHDVGQAPGDVGHAAAPDRHPLAVAVELDARAVVLVLDRGGAAVGGQRLVHVARDLGQHRQQRHEDARRRGGQRLRPLPQRERGHRGEVAGHQRGAAHRRRRHAGRFRDGLQHEPLGEAHAHLAEDHALEQVALLRRRARGQLAEPRVAHLPRPRPRRLGHRPERLRHIGQRQRLPLPCGRGQGEGVFGAGSPRTFSTRGSDTANARPLRYVTASAQVLGREPAQVARRPAGASRAVPGSRQRGHEARSAPRAWPCAHYPSRPLTLPSPQRGEGSDRQEDEE